ncbi:MAG: DUF4854 domain-containing protein [Oscillospiraceae bacterium]|nr:DUF4854 domain-containing protein [Oscillospiraceae bacterium]
MKKRIFALLLVAALAVAAVALTACSAKEDGPAETTDAVVENNNTEAPANNTPNAPAGNLAELAAEANISAEAANAASGGAFNIEVKADGDKLIYAYTYAVELPAEALQASLDAAGESFGGQIEGFRAAGYDISAIVIQFLDQNGKELASKEFN